MKISKWIKDLTFAIFQPDKEKEAQEVVNKIDSLLRRAARETDNEQLHDEIMAEIRDDTV